MIREILLDEYKILKEFLSTDIARNYFILLGLNGTKEVYDKVYGEFDNCNLKAVLFRRKTGVLQFFAPEEFDVLGFINIIKTINYSSLIGPKSYCDYFLDMDIFTRIEEGAYLSKLDKNTIINLTNTEYNFREITLRDLVEIVGLYKNLFDSFSSREIMEKKLLNRRGRGVCIEIDGKIVSVAQTDFETLNEAVIVGVATAIDYQRKGLATECMKYLCSTLLKEGKDLYLQYNNKNAEVLYGRLGFKKIDRVIHYYKI